MKRLPNRCLTESQFAQVIGKMKLSGCHSRTKIHPSLLSYPFKDKQINYMVKNYIEDKHFSRNENKELSFWNFYNLMTGASKSLYIVSFAEGNNQALSFSDSLYNALENENRFSWFLE